ncbi:MAG TPA: aspartate carbamoyltransferase [Candidatus Latescibacteria bacterium]|jgi:aspartate carbamoyltransferase catalytic subunit|nr:aspartate carbamoyltransferase [Gemmatimonadaceae bacterium]HJP32358.1 aspartate carbamoyltransferase [Candidatus Latescibacterota bacterium]|tara:strand:+ start:549 stop:1481 length:933 start_codon:yes stop_codon:yes gene_type:complete
MSDLRHIIEAQQFDRDVMSQIFRVAREMEQVVQHYGSNILNRRVMASLFYEPSTRTRLSFESAMRRLGGDVITTESALEFSSAAKGETLEDTIQIVGGYADIIVLRHFESGASRRAAAVSQVPVISAGDGPGQHPTQALLDVYTIEREIGRLDGISIALVGDLANGRTARSLCYLLTKFEDARIYLVAPEVVRMRDDIKEYLTRNGIHWEESTDLASVASEVDVIYQTRIQRERFGDRIEDYQKASGRYIIDRRILDCMQPHAIVMHPLPRVDEINAEEVDSDPRAAYFRQAHNGLYVRMALLRMILASS